MTKILIAAVLCAAAALSTLPAKAGWCQTTCNSTRTSCQTWCSD